ncbi:MAG: hydroxyacid dehydrogenase, partial [Candidatus Micrarchaeota archaeon]|nr:hydroxyacid dehydrogenase [Candidatus Micrarchaeota archaeon]
GGELKAVLANHLLLQKPNVIVTPHNAFNSTEALERILDTTVENILAFKAGKAVNAVMAKK